MDHALDKPAEIIAPRLRYEDVNQQSLAFMLAAGHPSAALWSDEGGRSRAVTAWARIRCRVLWRV